MIPANINKEWANKVTFATFCNDTNIAKLTYFEQCQLWEAVTGKKPDIIGHEEKKTKKAKSKGAI